MIQESVTGFRISPEQQHIWHLEQEALSDSPYRLLGQVLIEGDFQFEILQKALQYIVNRHEILRTSFRLLPGLAVPVQMIAETAEVQAAFYNLSDLSPAMQDARYRELLAKLRQEPANLASPDWLTCTLVTLERKRHLLVVALPALCGDATTLNNLTRELLAVHRLHTGGERSEPELPDVMQYADLAEWRHELLCQEDAQGERAYWHPLQSGRCWSLPTISQSDTSVAMHVDVVQRTLPARLKEALESFAQQQAAYDMPTVLLTVWLLTLKRLHEGQDLTLFLSRDLREKYTELAGALGPLTQYVPLMVALDATQPFTEALKMVHTALQQITEHIEYFAWDLPETTTETSGEKKYTSALSFAFEELPSGSYTDHASLAWRMQDLYVYTDQFAVQIMWTRQDAELTLSCLYNTQLLAHEEAERYIEQYLTLLSALSRQQTAAVETLEIVAGNEWQRVIVDCNRTHQGSTRNVCLHQLFEQQALHTPDRIAIYDDNEALSYAMVLRRVRQLSHYLHTLGVEQEVPVGIYMERSSSLLIAILGVLHAGGAYVPLDTAYPPERLAWIARNAAFPICLAQHTLLDQLPELTTFCRVITEQDWPAYEQAPEQDGVQVSLENLAYVLYTSGSTGQPKGVMVSQRGVLHYLSWCLERYIHTYGTGAPVHSSVAFDLTVTSLFAPLLAGQGITIVPQGPGVENLIQALQERGTFSFAKVTPAHLELLNRSIPSIDVAHGTHLLIVGGEQLYYEQLQFWCTHAPEIRIINEYGPTEAVVGCANFEVTARTLQTGSVPIGTPINNTQLYVLDRFMHPVPLMVPGELYIGGEGLARGYLAAPAITAERFLPDPFATRPGSRLYRTGDYARRRLDGTLEFLGRLDQQVKIRGFRVELAEIEAALLESPDVQEATVLLREEASGERRLVAYIVPAVGHALTTEELQHMLARKLPEYMHPSAWVMLERTPLTAHGKVDREALLQVAPQESAPDEVEIEEPRSFIEETLMDIWRQVLHLEHIGLHDNFFTHGGHSILATVAISRLRDALGIDVPVRLMFEAPTIAKMATHVETLRSQAQDEQGIALRALPETDAAPLTYSQERLWHLYELDPESPRWNNFLYFQLQGRLYEEALRKSFRSLVERHAILRSHFTMLDGRPAQVVSSEASLDYMWVDLSALPDEERDQRVQQLLTLDRRRPIDLRKGPLLRVTVIRLSEFEHDLLITTHHIIHDGWSRGILYRDLAELYAAQLAGRQAVLPELSLSYKDFAFWQRQWLQDTTLDTQLAYWQNYLADAPPLLRFPWDHPRPALQTFQTARQHFTLAPTLAQALKDLSNRLGVTLFMTLMASFKALLYRYSGQEDLVVGFPVANRDRTEIENLLGLFSDVLLLRTRFTGQTSFAALLQQVREGFIGAYANHDMPFMKIFEALKVQRHPSYNPLFQVFFEFLLMPGRQLALQDLSSSPIIVENRQSDLDLYLSMWEEAGTLHGLLAYNTALFTPETINGILQRFEILLQSIVEDPQQTLAQLPLITPAEEARLRAGAGRSQIMAQMKKRLLQQNEEKEK